MKRRWPSISAITGGLLCIALTPFMASIWSYEGNATRWADARFIPRVFGPWLASAGLLDFAPNYIVYRTYGRLFFLVYLLFIPMLAALQQAQFGESGTAMRSYRVLVGALLVGALADAIAYWGVTGPLSTRLQGTAFMLELVMLLAILVCLTIYGMATLKNGHFPRWLSWLILLSGPAGLWLSIDLIGYVPNGALFPMAVTWIVLAIRIWAFVNEGSDVSTSTLAP